MWRQSSVCDTKNHIFITHFIETKVPDGNRLDSAISEKHQLLLGYDRTNPNDSKKINDGYNEVEALKCGLITKDTTWQNIYEKLFPTDTSNTRKYEFNIDTDNALFIEEEYYLIFQIENDIQIFMEEI